MALTKYMALITAWHMIDPVILCSEMEYNLLLDRPETPDRCTYFPQMETGLCVVRLVLVAGCRPDMHGYFWDRF